VSEPDTFLREPEVKRLTGLGRTTRYEWIRDGKFPAPIRLSKRLVVWSAMEIADWQDQQKRRNGWCG
jgi:prophage regulatory protein